MYPLHTFMDRQQLTPFLGWPLDYFREQARKFKQPSFLLLSSENHTVGTKPFLFGLEGLEAVTNELNVPHRLETIKALYGVLQPGEIIIMWVDEGVFQECFIDPISG
ncbi:hypothetical protein CLI64_11005 [Nostoc sp. CENA543]|nr:hypothetical protein CLI64_11005 [Nostoc sp. CENA543]